MYLDLSELVSKRALGGSAKRITDRTAALRADYRAWVKYRVWARTSVLFETISNFF